MWSSAADAILETIQIESEDYSPPIKKQKHKKQLWTEKNMLEAINCCKNQELGIEEASLIYGIPKRSLRSRLKDKNFSVIDDKYRVFLLQIFPLQAELELVEYLQDLIQSQFTFTSIEVRRLAYELVTEKYHLNNLPKEKDCLLGNRWYRTFMAKYPHLDSENVVAGSFNSFTDKFYDALEMLVAKHHIDAGKIFCVDGIELKFRASNAYDFDKIFQRRKIIYTDAKAVCCISPSGVFTPPLFIKPEEKGSGNILGETLFTDDENEQSNDADAGLIRSFNGLGPTYDKLKYFCDSDSRLLPTAEEVTNIKNQIKAHLNKKLHPLTEENEEELREKLYEQFNKLRNKITSKYESSLNVLSNEIFHEWFKSFIAFVKPNCQERVILLLGDQSYVKSLKTIQLAKSSGVIFLVLPPHSVHKIYPLDGFTMSLNRNLSTCASVWLGKNPEFKIQEVPLQELFKKAYRNTVNPTIVKNGFTYSGIWPVNRNIFESPELGGESVLLKNRCQSSLPSYDTGEIGLDRNKTIDISKLCRICMKEKMYMKPLFDSSGPNYHGKKISEIVGTMITPDDGLPRLICQYCLVQLMDMVKVRNAAVESNKKMTNLRETLNGFFFESNESNDKILLSEFQCQTPKPTNGKLMDRFLTKDFQISSICRICMGEKPLMTSIFYSNHSGVKNEPDLRTKITDVSNCQIDVEDGLSSSICAFCRTSINQAWEFIRKVLSSDKRFREILAEKQNQNLVKESSKRSKYSRTVVPRGQYIKN